MGREQAPAYYDAVYAKQPRRARQISYERLREAARWIIGGSVLDLGCGVGLIANMIGGREYLGIDFSAEAIEASYRCRHNLNAIFWRMSFEEVLAGETERARALRSWDHGTVLLLEVLEHIADPEPVVAFAITHASRRVIIMVPRDMRGPAHVKQAWTQQEIEELAGPLSTCYLCGGPKNDWWWLAVHDKGEE